VLRAIGAGVGGSAGTVESEVFLASEVEGEVAATGAVVFVAAAGFFSV
jgi:hypothetical protein